MNMFSFDHLDEVEFEKFCYELLTELGFRDLNWRKGTGLNTSPADSGRDIECNLEKIDIDDSKYIEKWFVECKHHKKGIPPQEIQGILTWAQAENPNVILIIASNYFSNKSKDYLEIYKEKNKPKFKIKTWEKADLEKLCSSKTRLLNKYNIPNDFSFLSLLHPAHVLYLQEPPLNSLDYFMTLLNQLDPIKRDEALGWAYHFVIRPRYKEPVTGKETMRELLINNVSYDSFKNKCIEIRNAGKFDEGLLVLSITSFVLSWLIKQGDISSIDNAIQSAKDVLAQLKKDLAEKAGEKKQIEKLIKSTEERIKNIPSNMRQTYEIYKYYCENVVAPLLVEKLFSLSEK
jgi:hypothetical protein